MKLFQCNSDEINKNADNVNSIIELVYRYSSSPVNTLKPSLNVRHFTEDIF